MGDLNDGFGLEMGAIGKLELHPKEGVVGNREPVSEQEQCKVNYMSVATTYCKTGATFYSHNGGKSKIDHILIPQGATAAVEHM